MNGHLSLGGGQCELDLKRRPPEDYKPVELPIKNALHILGLAREKKRKEVEQFEMAASAFGEELSQVLINGNCPAELRQILGPVIEAFGHELFKTLKDNYPSLSLLVQSISGFCDALEKIYGKFFNHKQTENYYKLMHLLWQNPVQPHILNNVLRSEAAKILILLKTWKDSVSFVSDQSTNQLSFTDNAKQQNDVGTWNTFLGNSAEAREMRAAEDIKYFAFRANSLSRAFLPNPNSDSDFFCKEVLFANDIRELQEIIRDEAPFSFESWEKLKHAYVKISLIYGLLMVDGKIDRERIQFNAERIFQKLKSITFYYGTDPETNEPVYVMNPDPDGSIGKNSILISGIYFNTKEDLSILLKFLLRTLTDSISMIDDIRDLKRGRIMQIKDPRRAHPDFNNLSLERAERAAVLKTLAIILGHLGTSIDVNSIKYSVEGGVINENSNKTGQHRTLQVKIVRMSDVDPDGSVKPAGEANATELQIKLYAEDDSPTYIMRKTQATIEQLGIFDFQTHFIHMCEVFINRFEFSTLDSVEQRETAKDAFGEQMENTPYVKEKIAQDILEGLTSESEITKREITSLLKEQQTRVIILEALNEIQRYLGGLAQKKDNLIGMCALARYKVSEIARIQF